MTKFRLIELKQKKSGVLNSGFLVMHNNYLFALMFKEIFTSG
jgi:hypothetical protein